MGLFRRAQKTDLREEVEQLRTLRQELAEVTAELKVTSRILGSKADMVQARDDGDEGND